MPCFGGYKFSPMAFYGMSGHGISNHLVLHIVNHGSARAAIQPGYAIYSCVESDYCVLVHNQTKQVVAVCHGRSREEKLNTLPEPVAAKKETESPKKDTKTPNDGDEDPEKDNKDKSEKSKKSPPPKTGDELPLGEITDDTVDHMLDKEYHRWKDIVPDLDREKIKEITKDGVTETSISRL